MTDTIIVGAGIVGLSTAYWLAKAGHAVTVIEQGQVPNPIASSTDHHRLIRFPYGKSPGYCARMKEAFPAWREIWADLSGAETRYFADTGILCVSQYADDYTDVSMREMDRVGVPYERIAGADIADRFPFLAPGNFDYATLSEGGALMARHILTDLVDWLRRAGVQVLEHAPVKSVDCAAGAVTLADGRRLDAERVVVAAGVATAALLPELGLDLIAHRTVLVYADPPEDMADLYADIPCWNALGGDTDLYGMPALDGLPMKLGNGAMGFQDAGAADRQMSPAELQRMLRDYTLRFRGAERFRIRWHQANYWTQGPNSEFMLREEGRALVVSACSGHGFKFGALSGRDVADAVSGHPVAEVAERLAARKVA
ncbi:MAG: NAD(P)/FAD-dependent oxidoreductase [Paracoccaceae bacterium]